MRTSKRFKSEIPVEMSGVPGNYNETLNLDNIATLIYTGDGWNRDSIGLVLGALPPLNIDKPKADQKYTAGPGFAVQFPAAGKSGMRTEGASSGVILIAEVQL